MTLPVHERIEWMTNRFKQVTGSNAMNDVSNAENVVCHVLSI